jgi:hypothetical protein
MELSIKTEHFTPKFLYINLNSRNASFYPISYRTPTLTLNNLLFETPWMDAPFGICQYNNDKDKEDGKYYLDLSFGGYLYDTEIKNFFRVIESLDNFIINFIDNHPDLLGINQNKYIYNKQIRYNKNNPRYPPTIKLKIFEEDTKIVDLYDRKVSDFSQYIQAGAKVQALIRCNGLWTYENKWGLSWKVAKLSVKHPDFLPEDPFIDDGIDNDNISDDPSFGNLVNDLDLEDQLLDHTIKSEKPLTLNEKPLTKKASNTNLIIDDIDMDDDSDYQLESITDLVDLEVD